MGEGRSDWAGTFELGAEMMIGLGGPAMPWLETEEGKETEVGVPTPDSSKGELEAADSRQSVRTASHPPCRCSITPPATKPKSETMRINLSML